MNWFQRTFNYSIGRKLLMAITGLFLYSFLFVHVSGNLLLFSNDGGKGFEEFSHFMTHNPIIKIVEWVLFGSIVLHAIDGIMLKMRNRKARPIAYSVYTSNKKTFWTSRNTITTGLVILIFIIIHMIQIYFPYRVTGELEREGEGLFEHTKEVISNPYVAIFYIVSIILLGMHLHHGIASAFQTLGLRHPNYYNAVRAVSIFISTLICIAFSSMPIYFWLFDKSV